MSWDTKASLSTLCGFVVFRYRTERKVKMSRFFSLFFLVFLLWPNFGFAFEQLAEEAAPRRARFSSNSPDDVARCLSESVSVGCGFFSCLENSTCDTDGVNELCQLFLRAAASFNTEGKTFVKRSLRCMAQGVAARVPQTIRRCAAFQRMIAEVQEECYAAAGLCEAAGANRETIGEVVQLPAHFPNRYYITLLQSLQACDEVTVETVRLAVASRLPSDMAAFLSLMGEPCVGAATAGATPAYSDPASWRNVPVFSIQPGFQGGRNPTHLFARRRR